MRKALNENPMVQIGALAVLAMVVAVVFMMQMGGGAEPEAATDTAAPATATTPEAASASAPTTPETAALPATDAAPVAAGGTIPFEAGKGLPESVVDAYESGDVVVFYLMQNKEVEDETVRRHVEELRARSDTTVFVMDVKEVSRYSRIVQGVSISRVPAIIVLAPLEGKLAKGKAAPLPSATVSYGFRGNRSVVQTVRDAQYAGKQLGFDPG